MGPVIELDRLVVRLGERTILDGLSGALSGRAIGLLGPNGAGKSTLINTLLGFHPAASGSVRVFGADVREKKALRRLIGYMPESDAFISHMTGVRFVRYMAELAGLPAQAALERAHEAFFYVGLGEARYRKLGTYSLGMKQLAKLAQAIAHGPRLLLLDEPTNGLDIMSIRALRALLRDLRSSGKCLLFSSHVMQEVTALCDSIVIVGHGRIVASGTAAELVAQSGETVLEDAFVRLLGSGEGLAA